MEKAREKVAELVLGKAIEKVNEYKNKKQWEQLFVNTGEFFLKQVEKGELLIEDISALLSSESMKALAERVDEGSKYALREKLYVELKRLMLQYEIPANEANFYIANFITVIMHELETLNPSVFQCAYLGEWREKEEATLAEIKKELTHMSKQLRVIQNKKVEIYSLDQIEVDLVRQTAEPSLDLDFFEIDDEIFREVFESRLSDESIYVLGQCKEETIYCLLNELRRIDTRKVVLVVKKEEEWQNLRIANEQNPEMGGKILIPWFGAEQIYAIPNNTNIFVYGEEEYCVGKDAITMRKRKRNTIARKLEAAGMDSNVAYTMVDDTHGLYIPLKKKIIRGQYSLIPNWMSGESDVIIPLLLCGQWTETDGDITVLEDLCGKKYEQIVEELKPYTKGEDPLFIRFKVHGRVIYHLASVENAWDYLDSQVMIGDRRWKKYVDCVLEIVSEPDPIFDYPEEKQLYAEFYPDSKPFWSATLKKGLLRSLVMKAYYKRNVENQRAIDSVVGKILSEIKSKNQWLSIAGYFTVLCEASPNAVSRRLDDEWNNDTGLKEVFKRQEDNGIFSKNYYTHFIWGVEQFLLQKEYAAWAVRWFLKMYDLGIKYAISNSPEETLKRIFCTWLNVTVLTQKEKVYLAKEAFNSNYDVWELIYDELPGRSKNMIGGPSKPNGLEFHLYSTRKEQPLIVFRMESIKNHFPVLNRVIGTEYISMTSNEKYNKDLGIHLKMLFGREKEMKYTFMGIPIYEIAHVDKGLYTVSASPILDNETYCGSFDFGEKVLKSFEQVLPKDAMDVLLQPFDGRPTVLNFADKIIDMGIECVLGEKIYENTQEHYMPLNITKLLYADWK